MLRCWFVLMVLVPVSVALGAEAAHNSPSRNRAMRFMRLDHTFISHGKKCGAWLYLPEGISKPPVIVMGHGFGGQRWMRLPAYAERFAQRGMAVFVFDYRGFNDSEGEPRNYINPSQHLQDWEAAIAYVRTLDVVDAQRMALWGTSFSGGHVIVIAARDPGISVVVSQVPFTDGTSAASSYELTFQIKCLFHGIWDVVGAAFTGHRHNVGIAGKSGGEFAMMSRPDTWPGLMKLLGITDEKEFEQHNFCPANIAFTLPVYRPIKYASEVKCPALIIGAEKDTLFPPDGPKKMADRMKRATYVSLPMGHFDPYVGEPYEKIVMLMGDFLEANLGRSPDQPM